MELVVIIESLQYPAYLYEGVSEEELNGMTQDHCCIYANGLLYVGTATPEPSLAYKQYNQEPLQPPPPPPPPRKTVLTRFEFLSRFTSQERITIRTAAASNAQLYDFMQMLEISGEVQLTNAATIAGVQFLETASLLAPGRAAQILA